MPKVKGVTRRADQRELVGLGSFNPSTTLRSIAIPESGNKSPLAAGEIIDDR